MVNQPGTKHHGIVAKLKQGFPRSKARCRALATTALARWRFCRPRGRKATSGVSRRNQAAMVGWLGAQGTSEARTGFAETVTALGLRRKLDGAAAVASGKQRRRNGEERRRRRHYNTAQKQKEATQEPSPRQREAEDGHGRAWKQKEDRRR